MRPIVVRAQHTHTGRQAVRQAKWSEKRFLINDRLRKNRLLTELLEIGSPMSFAFDHTWDSSPCGTTHFDVYHFVFIWFRFYVCLVFTTKLFIGRTHFFLSLSSLHLFRLISILILKNHCANANVEYIYIYRVVEAKTTTTRKKNK